MNKQAEKFHQENKEMIKQLVESLDVLINKFDVGSVPGESEKSNALYMLDVYMDFLNKMEPELLPAFKKIKEASKGTFDEESAIKELLCLKNSASLLSKLAREKIIPSDEEAFSEEAGKALLDNGYCDEIEGIDSKRHYYVLSDKGEKAIKNKALLTKLKEDVATVVVPARNVHASSGWSNLYMRRVELINKYYETKRDNVDHIVFALDESKEMVFGCEVNNEVDVNYVFAGIFDEKIDDHLMQLKEIAESDLVDQVKVLVSSEEDQELLEGKGISTLKLPHIAFEFVE